MELQEAESRAPSTSRIEAFSDGVFAIVVTLLVLELRVPHLESATPQTLLAAFGPLLPKFASFIFSFIIVAIFWVTHHQFFHRLKQSTRGLLWVNIVFLLFLTFIPFPTALIGEYPDNAFAVSFFGVAMMLAALSFTLMRWYASRKANLLARTDEASIRASLQRSLIGPTLYAIAALAAWVNIPIAFVIYLTVPALYFLLTR